LSDIAPYAVVSRINGEASSEALKFGMGAKVGSKPGVNVLAPATGRTAAQFEGVVLNGFTQQMNSAGDVKVESGQTVGILRYGNVWVRVPDGVTPNYGDALYLIPAGANAGLFTNASASPNIPIAGRFVDENGASNVVLAELFNQKS
jgi:hypothetical protein